MRFYSKAVSRLGFALAILLMVSIFSLLQTEAQAAAPKLRGLLIGCTDYGFPAVVLGDAPVNDVAAMKKLAAKSGNAFTGALAKAESGAVKAYTNVRTLRASRSKLPSGVEYKSLKKSQVLDSYIPQTLSQATSSDVSLFYFSGHGLSNGNLVVSDGIYNEQITPTELKTALDKVKGRKLVFIDACFSGRLISKSAEAANTQFEEKFMGEFSSAPVASGGLNASGYEVMVASSGTQKSYTETAQMSSKPMGLFTSAISEGLGALGRVAADSNSDGRVTFDELLKWARDTNDSSTAQMHISNGKSPVLTYERTSARQPRIYSISISSAVRPGANITVRLKQRDPKQAWAVGLYRYDAYAGSYQLLSKHGAQAKDGSVAFKAPTAPGTYCIAIACPNDRTQPTVFRRVQVTTKPVSVSSVKLSRTNVQLKPGKAVELKATVSPASALNKSVTWKSSSPSVAKIDANGKLTALKPGFTKITVTTKSGGKKASAAVCVSDRPVTGIKLNAKSLTLKCGRSSRLSAQISPSNARYKQVVWSSSNTKVVAVSGGKVVARSKGTASVYAVSKDGGKRAVCKVTVK